MAAGASGGHEQETELMTAEDDGPDEAAFSVQVGQRLRAVRRMRGLSLDDVERESGGRWSASAVGAYERGFRNLSLPRLRDRALFYETPMSALIGEDEHGETGRSQGRIVIDLVALQDVPEAESVQRYLRSIILERGDYNGRVLSVRRDDLRAICSLLRTDEPTTLDRLQEWGALVEGQEPDSGS
jgi:transcriptional regulator with XRE-family HTH domain